MHAFLHQFKLLCGVTAMVMHGWGTFLFSRATRLRIGFAYNLWEVPFFGIAVKLSDLVSNTLAVRIGPVRAEPHNTSEMELLALGALVRQCEAVEVFEIGTYDGRSTRTLAMNLADGGRVTTLNLPPGQDAMEDGSSSVDSRLNTKVVSGCRFAGTPEEASIQQVFGDSATFDFAPYAGRMDVVFIDGAHSGEYVRNDTEQALQMIKPEGGLIVWHDGPLYGVVGYLQEGIRAQDWPLRWIEGTTLMIGWVCDGRFVEASLPLPTAVG